MGKQPEEPRILKLRGWCEGAKLIVTLRFFFCVSQGGAACSNSRPRSPPDPPQVFEPVFFQFEISGERVGATGAEFFFVFLEEVFSFYPMCLYSKYSQFSGEFKNV